MTYRMASSKQIPLFEEEFDENDNIILVLYKKE